MTDEKDDPKPPAGELHAMSWKLPFFHGAAIYALHEAARILGEDERLKQTAHELFDIAPAFFAALQIAEKHPEEFERALQQQRRIAKERYGGDQPWEWPKGSVLDLLKRFSPEAAAVLQRAAEFASDWRAQEGCGAQRLDDLCDAVTAFERKMEGEQPKQGEPNACPSDPQTP